MQKAVLAIALAVGGLIGYIDSRPNWDDTGVTAAAIFVVCGTLGAAGPSRPWLWALAVGMWIPVLGHRDDAQLRYASGAADRIRRGVCRDGSPPDDHSAQRPRTGLTADHSRRGSIELSKRSSVSS